MTEDNRDEPLEDAEVDRDLNRNEGLHEEAEVGKDVNNEEVGRDLDMDEGRDEEAEVDGDVNNEEDEGEEEKVEKGYIYRCLTKAGCSYVAHLPSRWPRTCGVLLGVVRRVCAWLPLSTCIDTSQRASTTIANSLFSCFRCFLFFR